MGNRGFGSGKVGQNLEFFQTGLEERNKLEVEKNIISFRWTRSLVFIDSLSSFKSSHNPSRKQKSMQIDSKTFKFVGKTPQKVKCGKQSALRKKKPISPKSSWKPKSLKTHLTPISKLFRGTPQAARKTRWSKTTESLRREVHLRHDSVTTWSWAVFFFLFSHHSFTSLFFRFWFQVSPVGCVFNDLFFDRFDLQWSPWFGGLGKTLVEGVSISPLYCFVMMFHPVFFCKYFEVQTTNCIISSFSKARELEGGVALVMESLKWSRLHQHGSHIPFK